MSKPETRDEVKLRKAIAAWQPRLDILAAAAGVKPAMVRLAAVTLEGGETEMQVCVSGYDDIRQKHDFKAVARAMKALAEIAQAPAIPVKRCSHSCGTHYTAAIA